MNIIRVLIYWHSYVHHGGFNLVHITYQVRKTTNNNKNKTACSKVNQIKKQNMNYQISVAVFGILVGPAVMFVMLQAGLTEVPLWSLSDT